MVHPVRYATGKLQSLSKGKSLRSGVDYSGKDNRLTLGVEQKFVVATSHSPAWVVDTGAVLLQSKTSGDQACWYKLVAVHR